MALSRVKVWISGEVLTASDLNTEFNNVINNAGSLFSPLTAALDCDGYGLTLDGAAATTLTSTAAIGLSLTTGAKAGTPGSTGSIANFTAHTFTDSATAGSGTATSYVGFAVARPTLAATNASVTTTDAATMYIANAPAAGTNETITNAWALWIDAGAARFDGEIRLTAGAINGCKTTVASATTPDIWTGTGDVIDYTGTTTATGFAAAPQAGAKRTLICAGASLLTHGANFILPGSANYTTAAGDRIEVVAITTSQFRLTIFKADGTNVVSSSTLSLKQISGYTYANNGSDATNDIDIAAGTCRDSTNAVDITLASALTKQSDAVWAVGTNAGMLDTGSVGNSDYYLWAIKRSDTGVVDILSSLSSTAPTMPANYDYKRLIGWFKRSGATIVAFHTYETAGGGLDFLWDSPTLDVNLANTLTTSRRTDAVKVPLNLSTVAKLNALVKDASDSVTYIYCPDLTDIAPSFTAAPVGSVVTVGTSIAGNGGGGLIQVRTSATGTIASRSTITADLYVVSTLGFEWARRN